MTKNCLRSESAPLNEVRISEADREIDIGNNK